MEEDEKKHRDVNSGDHEVDGVEGKNKRKIKEVKRGAGEVKERRRRRLGKKEKRRRRRR